jgi:hypothetical protein
MATARWVLDISVGDGMGLKETRPSGFEYRKNVHSHTDETPIDHFR